MMIMRNTFPDGKATNIKILETTWPKTRSQSILPVFLPFMGCPAHCVFCAQEKQTGINAPRNAEALAKILAEKKNILEQNALGGHPPAQAAFYGGTFTAIPEAAWKMCIKFISECRQEGLIGSFRCSTRPDSLNAGRLTQLRENGCAMVELGIQSFSNQALGASGRNYTCGDCVNACEKLRAEGLPAGVQLMPGMPGVDGADFLADVCLALELGAAILRFYPCVVVEGTKLAELWRAGKYIPWTLPATIAILAKAWNMAREQGVPVIRMGLAPEPDLEKAILAGPTHPSLGSRVMGAALLDTVSLMRGKLGRAEKEKIALFAPKSVQGYFWGCKGDMRQSWQEMGITAENLNFWERDIVRLETGIIIEGKV